MTTAAHVVDSLDDVEPVASVATVGVFDGVHRGHQQIVGRSVREAAGEGWRSVAVTFDRHPLEVVGSGSPPRYLQTLSQRVAALGEVGVDLVVVLAFTPQLARLEPATFVEQVLAGTVRARRVVVGRNFRFGHRAAGDVDTLTELGRRHGFDVEPMGLLELDGEPISSTQIREHLDRGGVEWAAEALGRHHVVTGPVVRGEGRGRRIGVPTANVAVDERLQIPAGGVYAGLCRVADDGHRTPCVVNIGSRPTFGGGDPTVEAHLLDRNVDLYGRHLQVGFVTRLRDERSFEDVDALVGQIHADIERAREALENRRRPGAQAGVSG